MHPLPAEASAAGLPGAVHDAAWGQGPDVECHWGLHKMASWVWVKIKPGYGPQILVPGFHFCTCF